MFFSNRNWETNLDLNHLGAVYMILDSCLIIF